MITTSLSEEQKWVVGLKAGEIHSFNHLFNFYGKRIYYFALGYLKSKDEAEEVVQEVFFKIWQNRQQLNPELSFKAYLFKIAYNYIQQAFIKVQKEQAYKHELIQSSIHFSTEMEERLDYHSLLQLTERIIDTLPPRQKEVLLLKRKENMSMKEISELLDISPKTAENHLTQALKKIKEALTEEKLSGIFFFHLFFA